MAVQQRQTKSPRQSHSPMDTKALRALAAFAVGTIIWAAEAHSAHAHGGFGGYGYQPIAPVYHHGRLYRDPAQRKAFVRSHPCPSTGLTYGSCPGFVVDHVQPLCAGGPDLPSNMAWQKLSASLIKDEQARAQCQGLHR